MVDAPGHSDALEAACREWREVLGQDAVLSAPDLLARYGRTTLITARGRETMIFTVHIRMVN